MRSDDYIREIVDLHIDPERGTPYWIDRARELGIDKGSIRTIEGLKRFGPTSPDVFRTLPMTRLVSQWAMRKVAEDSRYFLLCVETGGTTGRPKRAARLHARHQYEWPLDPFDLDVAQSNLQLAYAMERLDRANVPRNINWLMILPMGPHGVGTMPVEFPRFRGGWAYTVDLDPRWVKKLGARGDRAGVDSYTEHIREQYEHILEQEADSIGGVFTTSVLLERMFPTLERLKRDGRLQIIVHGGTPMSRETYRILRDELCVPVFGQYGISLCGLMIEHWETGSDYAIDYYPVPGRMFVDVISNPDDLHSRVEYGERGTVVSSRVSPDVFIPNQVQHGDVATLIPPRAPFVVDGLRDPAREVEASQIGVY